MICRHFGQGKSLLSTVMTMPGGPDTGLKISNPQLSQITPSLAFRVLVFTDPSNPALPTSCARSTARLEHVNVVASVLFGQDREYGFFRGCPHFRGGHHRLGPIYEHAGTTVFGELLLFDFYADLLWIVTAVGDRSSALASSSSMKAYFVIAPDARRPGARVNAAD
jgi:hypothetical protein